MPETAIGNILVVDDEVELKNALVEALSSQNFGVVGFSSPVAALEALRTQSFDVLLSDLMMPEMGGIQLVKEALNIDPNMIAIIMTGQGTIQTAVDAMKAGTFDYVLKPFRLQAVMPVLTRAINTRRLRLENLQLRETLAIYELCQTIAFTLDPQTIISKLADAALQQTQADEVSVLLPTEEGGELYVAAVRGENRQALLGERVPLETSISGWVARSRESLILDGEINDERFQALWPHPEIRSAISVPMQIANKLVGVININAINRTRPFTLGQTKALAILASTAAAALESASLYGQVERQRQRLDNIVASVPGIVWEARIGSDGVSQQTNFVSAHIEGMLGYTVEEWLGTPDFWSRVIHPEDRVRAEAEAAQIYATEDSGRQEFRYIAKDGRTLWVESTYVVIRDDEGGPVGLRGVTIDISERRRAEDALRASEAEMRALFASMTDVILVLDREGRHLKVAPTKVRQLFRPAEARIGKTIHEIFPKEEADFLLAQVRIALEKGDTHRVEYNLEIGGEEVWFDASISPMTEDSVIWMARDITERKRSEEEREHLAAQIESQRERLNNIISTVPGMVWEAWGQPDASSQQINFVSDYVEAMLGYSVEEWLSTPNFWLTIVHPDDREEAARTAAESFAAGGSHKQEFRWVTKDGRPIWVEANLIVVTDSEGNPIGLRGVNTDITERKKAEEALRESEERYRDLVENAHDIIYSHDLKGNYLSVNKAAEHITGYTREEALTLNMSQTLAPECADRAKEMIARKLAGENVTAYELEILAKDKRRVAIEVNSKLMYENGLPVAVQGIARDVTERKQLEEQLRQSQKMEAIGQLAGGVAHDFNNLLTAINGYSALALQRIDSSSSIKSYLEEIKKAGDRAANLTRQLLAFGRKQILQPVALDLNGVVSDMNKMLRRLIGEDIVLAAKLAADLRKIKADPGQVEQVLINLVVNARDAMPTGGSLTIETANVELDQEYASRHMGIQPGKYVMLAVSDTGTGMDEATRARIFEPFFTTKEKGKGTGLGLSTVYGIVQQSGGSIWVYSEPNQGTSFKVYLPELRSDAPGEMVESTMDEIESGSETILLVEDEEVVRGLTTNILEGAGYQVIAASGGAEAAELYAGRDEPIDLLLTDVVMPRTSGKEVAGQLTKMQPGLKVLFMSGYTDEAIVHHGVLDADVEFIQKPFTPAALSKKIREVLDKTNGGRP
jgi:two-component system, cell cycle sensor histidine kinase and response regulator CckA